MSAVTISVSVSCVPVSAVHAAEQVSLGDYGETRESSVRTGNETERGTFSRPSPTHNSAYNYYSTSTRRPFD